MLPMHAKEMLQLYSENKQDPSDLIAVCVVLGWMIKPVEIFRVLAIPYGIKCKSGSYLVYC
ncbi:hypothetical protein C0W93_19995 [Photobacterium leiognathi subsp. mandapamensis]|uniref:Uncharacterized protein n=1 Tax=Photobacterium leiognathi subsp. mandapamensis TaxID=48408 RepID=A0A2T3KPZ2_PHOLD|nr:hypothetical protein C0W93_19995 [Photobacterium leiognathi subsp. mandapamensis]PSW43142.1 hypothetical protein C0W40_13170 [Photobacterium leiognathi subsp. mandapamensis]PSW58730.1 hypothetical protein C0W50_04075 [Photobacterium leiognathi subsp. mandapamensis]